jgi:hypothetical protein
MSMIFRVTRNQVLSIRLTSALLKAVVYIFILLLLNKPSLEGGHAPSLFEVENIDQCIQVKACGYGCAGDCPGEFILMPGRS